MECGLTVSLDGGMAGHTFIAHGRAGRCMSLKPRREKQNQSLTQETKVLRTWLPKVRVTV